MHVGAKLRPYPTIYQRADFGHESRALGVGAKLRPYATGVAFCMRGMRVGA